MELFPHQISTDSVLYSDDVTALDSDLHCNYSVFSLQPRTDREKSRSLNQISISAWQEPLYCCFIFSSPRFRLCSRFRNRSILWTSECWWLSRGRERHSLPHQWGTEVRRVLPVSPQKISKRCHNYYFKSKRLIRFPTLLPASPRRGTSKEPCRSAFYNSIRSLFP